MRFWLLQIFFVAMLVLRGARAFAAGVVLVHPAGADPFVEEVYHRVGGELRAQAITFEQEEGGPNDLSEPASQALLGRNDARACISFNWHAEATVIRVWVADGAGKPLSLFEAVALERNAEAPTLLAARAVGLLSAGLQRAERLPALEKPLEPGHSPSSAPKRALSVQSWLVGAGVSGIGLPSRAGLALGPQISVLHRVSEQVGFGVQLAAPLLGARVDNSEASARLVQGLALLKVEAELLRLGPIGLSLGGGAGVHFLRVSGQVAPGIGSLAARRDQHLTLGLVAEAQGTLDVSARVSLVLGAGALLLLPASRVVLGREQIRLGDPGFQLLAGLRLAF